MHICVYVHSVFHIPSRVILVCIQFCIYEKICSTQVFVYSSCFLFVAPIYVVTYFPKPRCSFSIFRSNNCQLCDVSQHWCPTERYRSCHQDIMITLTQRLHERDETIISLQAWSPSTFSSGRIRGWHMTYVSHLYMFGWLQLVNVFLSLRKVHFSKGLLSFSGMPKQAELDSRDHREAELQARGQTVRLRIAACGTSRLALPCLLKKHVDFLCVSVVVISWLYGRWPSW